MMKKNNLFNKIGRDILKKELAAESFDRITASFYMYHPIDDPQTFRDELFMAWNKLNIFGRIYVATEGRMIPTLWRKLGTIFLLKNTIKH